MKLWMMRRGFHLEPANVESQAVLERIPARKLVEVEAVQRRNAAHNALYWVLLQRVAEWLDQDDVTADVLHEYFKLEAGIVSLIRLPGGELKKLPGSTNFHSMDQVAFAEYFEKCVRIAYGKLQVPPPILSDLLTPTLVAA